MGMKRWISLAVLFMIAAAPLATAQDSGPITWLSFETTKSGKSRELVGATIKEDGPMMDPSAHWDQVLLIVPLGGTTPEK